jgi:hypothetical protein
MEGRIAMQKAAASVITTTLGGLLAVAASGARATPLAEAVGGKNSSCSQACLVKTLADFKASVLAKTPVKLADHAEVRENMEITTVENSAWKDVKAIKSTAVFTDPVTGNVVSRDGVEMTDGKPAYISTRLRVEAGRLTEVEFSSDVARANPAYVWNLPAVLTATIPEGERMTREALDALAHRYFQALTDHKPVEADFDDARCNRFHSGSQVTNMSRNEVEGGAARTCVTSMQGARPWGPALEQRFPVIDPEHGTVLGITLLMYADRVMYVSEAFKVEKGRIVHIDNIGLMKPGLEHTTGFGAKK